MRRVTRVKYDGKRVTVHYEVPPGEEPDEYVVTCNARPAPSFLAALAALRTHVGTICELPVEYVERLDVRGASYSYGGKAEVMGATITALKSLTTARAPLVLNTPHLASAPMSETDEAPLLAPLAGTALETLAREALRYVDGHREQSEMFDQPAPGVVDAVRLMRDSLPPGASVTLSAGDRSVTLKGPAAKGDESPGDLDQEPSLPEPATT